MPRALLSVSDKHGIVEFARSLVDLGWEVLSTGGTARALREGGVEVTPVSDATGHPEMMDGRVKTLHPAIHAGLLARRDREEDMRALAEQEYGPIDLVAVNLYPFRETVADGASLEEAMEETDIGGPTMLRSAAKNHRDVVVVTDPADYAGVLAALRDGNVGADLRLELARKVFHHTSSYDAAVAAFLDGEAGVEAQEGSDASGDGADGAAGATGAAGAGATGAAASGNGAGNGARVDGALADAPAENGFARRPGALDDAPPFPNSFALHLTKVQDLRYGENPDQPAAFYAQPGAGPGSLPTLEQLHGKQLSFNNLMDIEGALLGISAWVGGERTACVIVKHTTPCGVALGADAESAYRRALAGDPTSAFGGIVALSVPVTADAAEAMSEHFLEVIVAPDFDDDAVETLTRKKNLRLIRLPLEPGSPAELDYKRVRGGLLVQRGLSMTFPEGRWKVATERSPAGAEWRDLRFAWRVAAAVKSNAIVLAKEEQTVGIGAGQMSRVDASRIAVMKAGDQEFDLQGAVLASDAFFPFRDGVDAAAEAGVRAVIQPGGSVRDDEVIEAANEHDIAMVFTRRRVFRH